MLESLVFAATAADVHSVIASGRRIVRDGLHSTIDVPSELSTNIKGLSL
jgi:cytosine/adenosine deaminase-related metal-dependent hydrolase